MNRFSTLQARRSIPLALLFLFLACDGLRADGRWPDCYVLSAGVDHYPHVNKLNGCLNDARNTTRAFQHQQGALFNKVYAHTLLDGTATKANILHRFQNFSRCGRSGDVMVLFLSGHGSRYRQDQGWFFLPYDYIGSNRDHTMLSDRELLEASDQLVQQGKKVIVVIDACFCGQLRTVAQPYFNQYRNPQGGGLVLMLSSTAQQTSAALGQFSAFAKAFADALTDANADLNHDGRTTIKEIASYAHQRTHQLLRQHGQKDHQDSVAAWSPSISDNMPLAVNHRTVARRPSVNHLPLRQ